MRDYDYRFDVFDRNSEGWSAASVSSLSGRSSQYVPEREVFDFNAMGETVFYRAVSDEKPIAYLQKLLDEGADESVRCGYGQQTALLCSMRYSRPRPDVFLFLQQTPNAAVSVGDRGGTTPLHNLAHMLYDKTTVLGSEMVYIEQLLGNGANPCIRDIDGRTPRDVFIFTAARLNNPTKVHAITNRLKMAEDCLVEDVNNQRLMAVMMATQERIGADSPLSELDPDILRMIVERSMGALLTADDIGEMQTEEIRALKRIGFTPEMRIAVKSWRDPSGALRA